MEEAPKKRLRGKQKYDAPAEARRAGGDAAEAQMDTLAASKPSPKKRLRGKQAVPSGAEGVGAPEVKPKRKAPKKGEPKGQPKAQQFADTLKAHFKQNAGAIGLAERVRKRQGKVPAPPSQEPINARDVFSKMPESVRKAPEFSRKFREEILQVPMTGITAKENYAKLIAERERLMTNQTKENAAMEWQRLEAGAGARGKDAIDRARAEYLMDRYHQFDKDALSHAIPKPEAIGRAEAERMGAMIAAAMRRSAG